MGQTAFEMLASFIPGVSQALAVRDIERARRAGDPAAAAMAATEFLPFGRLAGMMRRPGPIMSEIDVYHGSPHRFEEFDASKIGTGEGAQAYGHGIYLAEDPSVARSYRMTTTGQLHGISGLPDKKKWQKDLIDDINTMMSREGITDPQIAITKRAEALDRIAAAFPDLKRTNQSLEAKKSWLLSQRDKATYKKPGSLYTADLPDEMVDRMLDWDKPLSRQSREVQEFAKTQNPSLASEEPHFVTPSGEVIHWSALVDSVENLKNPKTKAIPSKIYGGGNWVKYGEHMMGQTTGGEFYRSLSSPSEWSRQAAAGAGKAGLDDVEASAALRGVGIPGIKYADAGSRGQGGSGTRNFVVFPGEEKKVKILKRE
ncbi:MAG: hypothetical protein ACO3LD_02745 [Luminiphilus sp.]